MRKTSLVSSLLLVVNSYQFNYGTAFVIDNAARTTHLLHRQSGLDLNIINNDNNNNNNRNRNDEDNARWKSSSLTRLHATTTSSSFDEQSNNHNSNSNSSKNKRMTALNAATGMSLPTTLLLDDDSSSSSSSDTSNDMGVGVLFLNLGGPKTGDDVEGTYVAVCEK